MSDTAKHPIAPVEPKTCTATQKKTPGVQLKVREENVSRVAEQGRREGGGGGGLGTGATGNLVMLQSTEEALIRLLM